MLYSASIYTGSVWWQKVCLKLTEFPQIGGKLCNVYGITMHLAMYLLFNLQTIIVCKSG